MSEIMPAAPNREIVISEARSPESSASSKRFYNQVETMIRILIADDYYLVRRGIRTLLENVDGFEVVGEAQNGQEAIKLVKQLKPDVIVMDISMPELDGIQATEQIEQLEVSTQVVILSMHANVDLVRQALQKGARGYVLKRSVTEDLLQAVRKAIRGETYLSPVISGLMSDSSFS